MKRKNTLQKNKERLFHRWLDVDYPGGMPRFQISLLAKDIAIFCLIPVCAIVLFKIIEGASSGSSRPPERRQIDASNLKNEKHSQIIQFHTPGIGAAADKFARRAPGTLVRVRLLNVVETFSNASVHAQIVDFGLGREFLGGTLIGDATSEAGSQRININFHFVRHPNREDIAVPVVARAMSLDGTYGLDAEKKEGFFARASIRSVTGKGASLDSGQDNQDFRTLVARAVANGLMQEFQSDATVANNKAQVLVLKPMTEFFVELTDYFPGQK
jgi:hypothetical protein